MARDAVKFLNADCQRRFVVGVIDFHMGAKWRSERVGIEAIEFAQRRESGRIAQQLQPVERLKFAQRLQPGKMRGEEFRQPGAEIFRQPGVEKFRFTFCCKMQSLKECNRVFRLGRRERHAGFKRGFKQQFRG